MTKRVPAHPMLLTAGTAAQLMRTDVVTVPEHVPIHKAASVLNKKGISAVVVVGANGEPAGLLSRADVVRYFHDYCERLQQVTRSGLSCANGFLASSIDATPVREVMVPLLVSVGPDTPVHQVVAELLERKVHRLFVRDDQGKLLGVISAIDVLRKLQTTESLARRKERSGVSPAGELDEQC